MWKGFLSSEPHALSEERTDLQGGGWLLVRGEAARETANVEVTLGLGKCQGGEAGERGRTKYIMDLRWGCPLKQSKKEPCMELLSPLPPHRQRQRKGEGTDLQGEDRDGDVTDLTITGLADWIELTLRWFCGDWKDTKE